MVFRQNSNWRRQALCLRGSQKLSKAATKDRAWWQVYLDNFMSGQVGESDARRDMALQKAAMTAWKAEGILTADDKQVLGSPEVTELGVRLDGEFGLLGASPERIHKTCLATLCLLLKSHWSQREAQVVLGRWIFILQFRRAAMACLARSWDAIQTAWPTGGQMTVLRNEVLTLMCLAPLLQSDMWSPYDGEVTCSDASETGGAAARALGLTWSGRSLTASLLDTRLQPRGARLLIISLFNGIGGAYRIYDVLGVSPEGRISIECLKEANRVCRSTWSDVEEVLNVQDVTLAMVQGWANCYSEVTEVHFWGGFPCIHLSSVRAFRRNLSGPGSDLFWTLLQILQWVQQVFSSFATVRFCIENVASMDADARQEISYHLDVQPIKLDPSDILPFSRPRLAWCSEPLYPMEGLELSIEGDYVRAWTSGQGVNTSQWIRPGWCWDHETHGAPFPTFMKASGAWHHRQCPQDCGGPVKPLVPSGGKMISDTLLINLHPSSFCLSRLDNSEREILMGFGPGRTATCRSASDVKQNPKSYRDMRDSLVGDSFAISSFAIMGAAMCASWMPRMSPEQLGLAPGASAHPSVSVPMTRWLAYAEPGHADCTRQDLVQCLGLTTNHTGADVRLTSGSVLGKRAAHASVRALWWQWKHLFSVHWNSKSHINFLEMKMILLTLLWKARSPKAVGKRWLHLEGSMVCLYILTKGRTSSHMLQPLCSQIGAVQLALSSTLLHAHVSSSENPTDAASRSWCRAPYLE